jgi:hypothetical protein
VLGLWLGLGLAVLHCDFAMGQGGDAGIEVLSHVCKYGVHEDGRR